METTNTLVLRPLVKYKPAKRSASKRTIPLLEQGQRANPHSGLSNERSLWNVKQASVYLGEENGIRKVEILPDSSLQAASESCRLAYWTALATTDRAATCPEDDSIDHSRIEEAVDKLVGYASPHAAVESALWLYVTTAHRPDDAMGRVGYCPSLLQLKGGTGSNAPQLEPAWYAATDEGKALFASQLEELLAESAQILPAESSSQTEQEEQAEDRVHAWLRNNGLMQPLDPATLLSTQYGLSKRTLNGISFARRDNGTFRVIVPENWQPSIPLEWIAQKELGGLSVAELCGDLDNIEDDLDSLEEEE